MPTDFLSVLKIFQDSGVRYVLVGGLAVLLHGIDRLTADTDLVVDLTPDQASLAVEILLAAGFKAGTPVDARLFADPAVRELWRTESGMLVFSFWDPENRRPTVDLCAEYLMDFELLYSDAVALPWAGVSVRVASVELMNHDQATPATPTFGSWRDAENLRKWSFLQRTPPQRLDWLVQARQIAYQCAALQPRIAGDGERA